MFWNQNYVTKKLKIKLIKQTECKGNIKKNRFKVESTISVWKKSRRMYPGFEFKLICNKIMFRDPTVLE